MNTKSKFDLINLENDCLKNLTSLGYEYMTPIQEKSLPYILEKNDVVGKAKTGSGKDRQCMMKSKGYSKSLSAQEG